LSLAGPSKATLRNLTIQGTPEVTGVVVENCDQPSARVCMDQVSSGFNRNNFLVNRLDDTDVSLLGSGGGTSSGLSFQIIGGPRRARGQVVNGRVAMFGGGSAGNELSYDLSNGGSFVGQDLWHEGPEPRFIRLADSGSFTLQGAKIQRYTGSNLPAVEVINFTGDVALIATWFDTSGVTVTGEGADSRVLILGAGAWPGDNLFTNESSQAEFALLDGLRAWLDPQAGFVTVAQPAQGFSDPSLLVDLLGPARREHPRPLGPLPDIATDVRFYRVLVWQCGLGIQLNRGPLVITQQPQDQTVDEFNPVSFQVEVAGLSPSYQWFQNGLPISNATNQSFFLPSVQFADHGSQIR
jgi:hypothetical protein